jgi:hypothetical protein
LFQHKRTGRKEEKITRRDKNKREGKQYLINEERG